MSTYRGCVRNPLNLTAQGCSRSYLKVLTVLINGGKGANGERIIEKSTLDEMLKDQIEHIAPEKGMERDIAAATPSYTYPIQMMPGVKKGWVSDDQ